MVYCDTYYIYVYICMMYHIYIYMIIHIIWWVVEFYDTHKEGSDDETWRVSSFPSIRLNLLTTRLPDLWPLTSHLYSPPCQACGRVCLILESLFSSQRRDSVVSVCRDARDKEQQTTCLCSRWTLTVRSDFKRQKCESRHIEVYVMKECRGNLDKHIFQSVELWAGLTPRFLKSTTD